MNDQPKSKTLIVIIAILLLANIGTLSYFLLKSGERKGYDRHGYVSNYLKKEIGFSDNQLKKYDSISKVHRNEIRSTFMTLSPERKKIFTQLAAASFSDSGIQSAAAQIHEHQKLFEINMLKHLKDVRDICTGEQKKLFDTGFYKIMDRRSDGRKDKN